MMISYKLTKVFGSKLVSMVQTAALHSIIRKIISESSPLCPINGVSQGLASKISFFNFASSMILATPSTLTCLSGPLKQISTFLFAWTWE